MSNLGKIVLWAAVIGCVGLGGVWIIGGKESEYSTGLAINASPESVFYFLTNPEHQKSWHSGLDEVGQHLPIVKTEAGIKVVKTPRVVTSPSGKQVRFEDQVIRFEQNEMLTIHSSNDMGVVISIFQLELKDDQIYLTYRVKTNNHGLGRIWGPLSKDETQSRIDGDILKLKELVESSSPPIKPAGTATNASNGNADQPASGSTFSFN